MSRWYRYGLAVIVLMVWLAPVQVSAYSYGDANTEDVAETFKVIAGALSGDKADWKTVQDTHQVRRSEIQSHFGESVALTLDKNIEAKDSKLLIANYKAVLVMNLDRRFTYALKDVADYAAAKLLLAKAKATFDTLAPYMSSGTDDINKAFDDALEALGNPGLFGVGEKEADPDTFKVKVDYIYGKVKPSFPYKAYVKPASTATGSVKPTKVPAATQKPSATKAPTATSKPTASDKPVASDLAAEENPSATPGAEPSLEPAESISPSPRTTETTPPAASGSEGDSGELSGESESEVSALAEASQQGAQEEGHAPMERTDKTNPLITIFVIAGVVIVGGGVIWFIRKKGLL
ncbi:hypothetical protein [Paenibacillus harenae]|uniref:Uncharacterized protein Veg n=1 Tax=Paenibacillus harenae TaxID=306543 RepID=A0ABT9TUK1_PAEHA|nr:hypothetical protein [Paenibacillus harenae]MDQ0111043.1 uncharacterized protein Veg [Paenibacillus harenae]